MVSKLVIAAISTCCLCAQSDWRFADPNSNLVAGLNWRTAVESPLGPILKTRILRLPRGAFLAAALDQVDGLSWSSRTIQTDGRRTTEWVLALTGRFDLNAIGAQLGDLGYVSQPYRSLTLLVPARSSSKAVQLAMVDARTILVADRDPLRQAVDRILDPNGLQPNPLFAQADLLAATNELWVAGSGSPLVLYRGKLPDIAAILPVIQGYSVALTVHDPPVLQLNLAAATTAEADVFVQLLRLLPVALKLKPAEQQAVQSMWAQAQFTQDNGVARAVVPLDLLLRALLP